MSCRPWHIHSSPQYYGACCGPKFARIRRADPPDTHPLPLCLLTKYLSVAEASRLFQQLLPLV
jgi:hypothetical protein